MKTEVKNNSKHPAKNNSVFNGINTVTAENKTKAFIHGNPVNEVSAPKEAEAEKPKEEVKAVVAEQPATEVKPAAPVAEAPKAEVKAEPVKFSLNLEETLKLVVELSRKKVQRDKLIETITNLDDFEIELKEDADETEGNAFQGCVLTIEDDNRRKFVTKNPVIIFTVAQQVNSLCVGKLAEIEAGIIIPV
jgi:hypothetical protein